MSLGSDERLATIVDQLRAVPGLAESLPGEERAVAEAALGGDNVHAIAQERGISTEAVWSILGNAARLASGREMAQVEVGGLGSDTDPGINGGYGDTGFGAIDNEPPYPTPEEPTEGEPRPRQAR